MIFGYTMMLIAITISAIAAWYSIAGLTAIFAAAVIPVIIMGGALEAGKIVATVFLHNQWHRVSWLYKTYLVPAIVFLMLLTSMGIFGFLSKAHSDQSLVSGDAMSKVAIFDEKIKTEQDNIAQAKKAIEQMNAQVDQMLSRTDSERGTDKAVTVRKQQAKERAQLQADITKSQKIIQKLQEERAPLAAEFRKVEAEVGPIKYIAALIYGDNPDQNVLEKAVRWVIILIVIVFDPLALCLILASNKQLEWAREDRLLAKAIAADQAAANIVAEPVGVTTRQFTDEEIAALDKQPEKKFFENARLAAVAADQLDEQQRAEQANKIMREIEAEQDTQVEILGPAVPETLEAKTETKTEPEFDNTVYDNERLVSILDKQALAQPATEAKIEEQQQANTESPETPDDSQQSKPEPIDKEIAVEDVTQDVPVDANGNLPEYVSIDGKSTSQAALKSSNPSLYQALLATADGYANARVGFGTEFPRYSKKGDIYTRVDVLPNRVYKFNGQRWIEVVREQSQTYLENPQYIQHLITKLERGEYDPEWLTPDEQEQIAAYLARDNGNG